MVRFFRSTLYPNSLTGLPTDSSVFLVIVVLAAKSGIAGYKMPRGLRTIVQDATIYFLVIFTSHLVFEMTLVFARVSISTPAKLRAVLKFLQPVIQLLPSM